jgi:hypothetical protein
MIETAAQTHDEFYIGYEERMPPQIARRVVRAVLMFGVGAAAGIGVALLAQQTLPASRFEFGVVQRVAGILRRDPYPFLEVDGRRVWLVGLGKFGAAQVVGETPTGSAVIVEGSAIQRGDVRMLETATIRSESTPNPFRVGSESTSNWSRVGLEWTSNRSRVGSESTPNGAQPLVTLTGQIVDSKCFLGVMNPGEGTVHRDCARRCLSGGIPPMLVVRNGHGREELVVLVSADGGQIGRELGAIAGRPVTVTGRLARDRDQYLLYADANGYRAARPN